MAGSWERTSSRTMAVRPCSTNSASWLTAVKSWMNSTQASLPNHPGGGRLKSLADLSRPAVRGLPVVFQTGRGSASHPAG